MATEWAYQDMNRRDVVSDDNRDPDTSWQIHLDNTGGKRGGVDHGSVTGLVDKQPVYSPADGVLRKTYLSEGGSAGRQAKITMSNGWSDVFCHLSSFDKSAVDGKPVEQGQIVGYIGGSGYNEDYYYKPHLHHHRIDPDGNRQNPWHYFAGDGVKDTRDVKPGVIEYTLTSGVPNVTFYRRLQWYGKQAGFAYSCDGFMSVPAWRAVQTLLRAYGYSGPIDGEPGDQTFKALQRLAAAKGGYTGPIDGDLGTQSYKALSKFLNTL